MREVVVGTERFKTTSHRTLLFSCGLLLLFRKQWRTRQSAFVTFATGASRALMRSPNWILTFRYEKWLLDFRKYSYQHFGRGDLDIMRQQCMTDLRKKCGTHYNTSCSSFGNPWKWISSALGPATHFLKIKSNMSCSSFGNLWKLISLVLGPYDPTTHFPKIRSNISSSSFGNLWKLISSALGPSHAFPQNKETCRGIGHPNGKSDLSKLVTSTKAWYHPQFPYRFHPSLPDEFHPWTDPWRRGVIQ